MLLDLVKQYDNEKIAFINDCGIKETQKVPYRDLEKAMRDFSKR